MGKIRKIFPMFGLNSWTDRDITPGSPKWQREIFLSINRASCMIVILSPEAKISKWVNIEIQEGLKENKWIIPLLASGDAETSIPDALIDYQYIDIRDTRFDDGMFEVVKQLYRMFRQNMLYRVLKEATLLLPESAQARAALYRDIGSFGIIRLSLHATYGVFFRDEIALVFRDEEGVVGDVWDSQQAQIVFFSVMTDRDLSSLYDMNTEQKKAVKSIGCAIAIPVFNLSINKVKGILFIDSKRDFKGLGIDIEKKAKKLVDNAMRIATRLSFFMAIEDNDNPLEYYVDDE